MKINILGFTYEVIYVDNGYEGLNAFGRCVPKDCKIYIAKDISDDQSEATFLHEVLEAINSHLELRMEHHVVTCLETSLRQVFKANKGLMRKVCGK